MGQEARVVPPRLCGDLDGEPGGRATPTASRPLVIFDFDGTLADTWDWLAAELVQGSGPLGSPHVTRADLEALRALPTRAVLASLGISRWHLPRIASHLRRRMELAAHEFRLFAGVPDLLVTLGDAGVTLALASSNTESIVQRVLGSDLAARFSVFACDAAVFGKASKLRSIRRRIGTPAASTIVVGDETRDVEAARSAGLDVIAVEWGYADASTLRALAPGRTARSVDELGTMLLRRCACA